MYHRNSNKPKARSTEIASTFQEVSEVSFGLLAKVTLAKLSPTAFSQPTTPKAQLQPYSPNVKSLSSQDKVQEDITLIFLSLGNKGFVTSKPNPVSEDSTVDQLIITDENNWDYNLLVNLFNEEDSCQIMKILLTCLGREDRIYWIHD
ncbi:Uncharacterized protein Fot_07277 [Forsythia ovata]|uniref:Uncharacterized protein n=1 Tax=Forsythia ovata TaxID=205694 RepID=A0ABD1WY91_9LAMI